MENQAEKIKTFILNNVATHSQDLVSFVEQKFPVTRTTIHRHINTLLKQNKIYKSGTTLNTRYYLQTVFDKHLVCKLTPNLSEDKIWHDNFAELKLILPDNVYRICEYGFTEIVNNAIDHSEGKHVIIESKRVADTLKFTIFDDGIGILKKIMTAFSLSDERESILQLSKGKLTTDPKKHSGEGIFFTSRVFDSFSIMSNGTMYLRNNNVGDWFVERRNNKDKVSTLVEMLINVNSNRILNDIFQQYTNIETTKFDKTHILVNLSLSEEDVFVSRSQAKRILAWLEKFEHIILDFKGIKSVGQAFVDEVFRVYKDAHPGVNIEVINTNEDIDFMIKRGIITGTNK